VSLLVSDGVIAFPERPGIGIELLDDLIGHFRIG
jgi:hypothetical protein